MAAYDRDAVIEGMLALYKTVLHMDNGPATNLRIPPASGWDFSIDDMESLRNMKTPDVIDLIRRLPYTRHTFIAYQTDPIAYFDSEWYGVRHAANPWGGDAITEDYELPLTFQSENVGTILILDTRTGLARIFNDRQLSSRMACTVHTQEDQSCPLLCRYQIGVPVRPVVEVLRGWCQNFLDLKWMVGKYGQPDIKSNDVVDEPEELDVMRAVYREHGWPENYQAVECREALSQIPDSSHEDSSSDHE